MKPTATIPALVARASRRMRLLVLAPLFALPAACAIDPGYGYGGPDVSIGLDYYQPGGFDYGGWGGDYHGGPPRGGPRAFRGDRGGAHAWHAAPASHGMPSLPAGRHGGGRGGRGGGRR